jgi:hypothetical protein
MTIVKPIANGQTDLEGNRLILIPSAWARGYYEIIRKEK